MSTTTADQETSDQERKDLELRQLRSQVEKLTLEVAELRSSIYWNRIAGRYLPLVTAVLAIAGFWFSIIQFSSQARDSEENRKNAESNRKAADEQRVISARIEAAKPFWDAQFRNYLRASEAAATIATTTDAKRKADAEVEFWMLYWGPLAAVEDVGTDGNTVERAMVHFGRYLREHKESDHELLVRSIDLAHAIRKSASPTFGVPAAAPAGVRRETNQ